jgi:hypothetical protein
MGKNNRNGKSPYEEGDIRIIYEKFFGKLIFAKPDTHSIKEWLNEMFHTAERTVDQYRAREDFELPGLLYIKVPHLKIQGKGYRSVPKGARLYVRTDSTNPRSVDIEYHAGPGQYGTEQVFCVPRSDWSFIQQFLKKEI